MVYAPAFDAARFFPMVRDVLPTWFTAPPAIDQALIAHAPDHLEFLKSHSPRFVRSGASPLPVALLNEIERIWNAPMVEAYGMSECPVISSNHAPPGPRKPGSIGLPCGVEVVLLDDSGRLPPRNTERVGEIAVRGPQVMDGYERNPDANAGAFIDGWFRTGDLGHFDDDGFLYYTGRRKEMINRAGMKIAPLEVDQVILSHPSIADALTFSMPDARLGEDLGVAAVLRPGADTTVLELRWFAAEHLSEHNVPRRVVFVDQIPAGVTGKPQRIGLAANSECTSNPDPANARSLQRRAR
jgi:acyl-CoA synthetase (AMP-forming)/AMP-acid ligase II